MIETFGDWEETEQHQRVLVCTSDMILDIPDREIYWVEVVLAGCDRNGCFVGSQDDRNEHRPMS